MNDRIKELCARAISDVDGIQNPDTQHMYIPDCFRDRFAELIVQECVTNVKDWEKDSRNHISYMLERHFGVDA